ncbi:MAG: hypothetical protein JXQ75_20545 [Phycisphaerae bacterium]|nr:hypothetical protein [Phycisphaerae bacterium]
MARHDSKGRIAAAVLLTVVLALPAAAFAGRPTIRSGPSRGHPGVQRGAVQRGSHGTRGVHDRRSSAPRPRQASRPSAPWGGRRSAHWGQVGGRSPIDRTYGRTTRIHVGDRQHRLHIPRTRCYPRHWSRTYVIAPTIEYCPPLYVWPEPRYVERHYTTYVPPAAPVISTAYDWPTGDDLAKRAWESWEAKATGPELLEEPDERRATVPGENSARGEAEAEPDTQQARLVGIALGRGDRAFEDGRYAEARDEYIQALVLADGDAGVRIALGIAEFALGRFEDASRAVREGVARMPALARSSLDLRDAYGQGGDFAAHLAALEAVVEQNPHSADARFLLGFVRYTSGDRPGGLEILEAYQSMPESDRKVGAFIELARQAEVTHGLSRGIGPPR